MNSKKTFYLVKVCHIHGGCHGWAAMDIDEDVGWLPIWLQNATLEGFTVKFMAEMPDTCQECKSKKKQEKEYEH